MDKQHHQRRIHMADPLADTGMTARVIIKRALEKAGFVFLKGGWVRKEDAPRLRAKIQRAVADAAPGVDQVKREVG
jgi:hypothetical protein